MTITTTTSVITTTTTGTRTTTKTTKTISTTTLTGTTTTTKTTIQTTTVTIKGEWRNGKNPFRIPFVTFWIYDTLLYYLTRDRVNPVWKMTKYEDENLEAIKNRGLHVHFRPPKCFMFPVFDHITTITSSSLRRIYKLSRKWWWWVGQNGKRAFLISAATLTPNKILYSNFSEIRLNVRSSFCQPHYWIRSDFLVLRIMSVG